MKRVFRNFAAFYFLTALLCAFLGADSAFAAQSPPYRFHTEWTKLSAVDGRELTPPVEENAAMAVLWLIPEAGYYTYSHEPGSEGMPLKVTVACEGASLHSDCVQLQYPEGSEHREGNSVTHHLHGRVPVFLIFKKTPDRPVTAKVSLLACSDKHCFPVTENLLLPVPPAQLPNAAQMPWFKELKSSSHAPCDHRPLVSEQARAAKALLPAAPASVLLPADPSEPSPALAGDLHTQLLPAAHTSVFQKKSLPPSSPTAIAKPSSSGTYAFTVGELDGTFKVDGWARAVGIGLLAGLLLNFMPCVLPVLTMKFSVLLGMDCSDQERRHHIREHTVFFAAGVVTWFTLLAVLSGLTGMLWGQLFQSAEVLFFMLLIVFCMALSMFDVFHLPVLDLQPHQGGSPRMQAFSTGMFTTLLATPCSGPLLGGVLAWGMTKPLPVLMTVFGSTGLGMALPYVFIACFPGLVRFLPRPGAWLSALERMLGLLLMGTAIYLFSLLPTDLHVKTLITLLVAATSAWIWGRWGSLRGSVTRRMFLGSFAVGAIALSTFWAFLPAQQENVPWEPFTEKQFRADLGKQAMIVEFTADWCPTCKVLERTTLAAPNLLPILDQYSVKAVKVDMTQKNDDHDELLKALGSASIPLLAVFPDGERASQPVILRDIYTVTDLHLALRQAKIPHKRMVEMLYPVKLLSQP